MAFPFFLPRFLPHPPLPEAPLVISFISLFVIYLCNLNPLRIVIMSWMDGLTGRGMGLNGMTPKTFRERLEAQQATYAAFSVLLEQGSQPLEASTHARPGVAPYRRRRPRPQRVSHSDSQVDGDNYTSALVSSANLEADFYPEAEDDAAIIRKHALPMKEYMANARDVLNRGDKQRSPSVSSIGSGPGQYPTVPFFTPAASPKYSPEDENDAEINCNGLRALEDLMANTRDSLTDSDSLSNGDNHRSASTSSASPGPGVNPTAPVFTPASAEPYPQAENEGIIRKGVRTPGEFMAKARSTLKSVQIVVPPRRIAFGNLPEGTTISDIICLVFGGAIMRAWSVTEGEVIVEFCHDISCRRYYETHRHGITVFGDQLITIEKPEDTPSLSMVQRKLIKDGVSRLVRITGITNHLFAPLSGILTGYEIDHTHLVECDKPGVAHIFFRNLTHAFDFRAHLEEDTARWGDCVIDFLPDPCELSDKFHSNMVRPRFVGAVVGAAPEVSTPGTSIGA